jgi:hypothetical protein
MGICTFFAITALLVVVDDARPKDERPANDDVIAVQPAARDLVFDALRSEQRADQATRAEKLRAAIERDPDYAPAHWQSGEVQFDGRWMSPESVARRISEAPDRWSYEEQLGRTADTVEAHLKLARWSRTRHDPDAERGQLLLAVDRSPDDPRPRRLLGLKQHDGKWLSDAEISDAVARRADAARVYQSTKTTLLGLMRDLADSDAGRRQQAETQILALRDPRTIPALEEILCHGSQETATLAVRAMGNIPDHVATWAIIRQAIWSEWDGVTAQAAVELRARDAATFVPDLIELLTPTEWAPERWVRLPHGSLASVREVKSYRESDAFVMLLECADPPVVIPFDARRTAGNTVVVDGRAARIAAQARYTAMNADASKRIDRVARLLGLATGSDGGTDQAAWRRWWSKITDTYDAPTQNTGPGSTRYLVSDAPVYVATRIPVVVGKHSCFVAGTPVWTRRGPVAIDHVQIGDLVLSMNPETGELGYQTVLQRTVRPATQVKTIEVEGDRIGATMGHPFWVSGTGWVRVKDLHAGDPIRLNGRVAKLENVTSTDDEIAYNLVVAEFHSYFVGNNQILVHDNQPIRHAFRTVPGLPDDR